LALAIHSAARFEAGVAREGRKPFDALALKPLGGDMPHCRPVRREQQRLAAKKRTNPHRAGIGRLRGAGPVDRDAYLGGGGVPDAAPVRARVVFALACYGAGTPIMTTSSTGTGAAAASW
jgi:hypothetical protein